MSFDSNIKKNHNFMLFLQDILFTVLVYIAANKLRHFAFFRELLTFLFLFFWKDSLPQRVKYLK